MFISLDNGMACNVSRTLIKDKECKSGHANKTMAQSISKDSICRNNNADVFENFVPDTLFSPSINIVQTG